MDNRSLPFVMSRVSSEEEEAIALLSYVADDLLGEHHRAVAALRRRARRVSNILFVAALLLFTLFLAQDFETAPLPILVIPAVAMLVLLLMGIFVRTRLVDGNRLGRPEILHAQKLSWQWLAIPLDEERMILWDTLTDEATALDLPANPPKRPDWLWKGWPTLTPLDEEKALVSRLGDALDAWQIAPDAVRLPRIEGDQPDLLSLLASLPRGRSWSPAPPLPPARSLEAGQSDLRRLMRLYQERHIYIRQLDAWEEALHRFIKSLERTLRAAQPEMVPPPAPPAAHPSGDVQALLGTLDLVRSNAMESLRLPLQDELSREKEALAAHVDRLTQEWERERNGIHYSTETVIGSLQRQLQDMEQRLIPETQQALTASQVRLREATERVATCEAELADKRKQLLLAGSGSDSAPRASDDRKRELAAAIERLSGTLPEMRRNVNILEEIVATNRTALERAQRQLDRLQVEHQEYAQNRDQQLGQVDQNYQTRQDALRDHYAPIIRAIEADLAFFDILIDRFAETLDPFRVDLMMDDEAVRPYNEVIQQTAQIFDAKLAALTQWTEQVLDAIRQRRETVQVLVAAMDEAALPNFGLRQPRLMLLPIWYVEARGGHLSLWPWQRQEPKPVVRLVAPFIEAKEGRRLALPGGDAIFLRPLPGLQARLNSLLEGERRDEVRFAARHLGRGVPFDPKLLQAIAIAAQMPRAMLDVLLPLHTAPLPSGDGTSPPLLTRPVPTGEESGPLQTGNLLTDEFMPENGGGDPDAWQESEEATSTDTDAWQEPANGASTPLPLATHAPDPNNAPASEEDRP
ncbi:MAG TPA: hypothetical protein VF707_12200 [Ardenticatenaceae bacterium]